MIVKNKIWEELKQAKAHVISIREYTDKHRKYRRWYDMFIAIVASGGAFGSIFNVKVPFWATILIGFVSVVKSVFPQILQPEQELCELDSLIDYYNSYLVKVEQLFYEYTNNKINEDEAVRIMSNLKLEEADKLSKINKLLRNISRKQKEKNNKEAEDYLLKVYYDKYDK